MLVLLLLNAVVHAVWVGDHHARFTLATLMLGLVSQEASRGVRKTRWARRFAAAEMLETNGDACWLVTVFLIRESDNTELATTCFHIWLAFVFVSLCCHCVYICVVAIFYEETDGSSSPSETHLNEA